MFQEKYKNAFVIYTIPPQWQTIDSWNPSLCKTGTYIIYTINIKADDDLATKGARASAAIVLTYLNQDNSFPACQILIDITYYTHIRIEIVFIFVAM